MHSASEGKRSQIEKGEESRTHGRKQERKAHGQTDTAVWGGWGSEGAEARKTVISKRESGE